MGLDEKIRPETIKFSNKANLLLNNSQKEDSNLFVKKNLPNNSGNIFNNDSKNNFTNNNNLDENNETYPTKKIKNESHSLKNNNQIFTTFWDKRELVIRYKGGLKNSKKNGNG